MILAHGKNLTAVSLQSGCCLVCLYAAVRNINCKVLSISTRPVIAELRRDGSVGQEEGEEGDTVLCGASYGIISDFLYVPETPDNDIDMFGIGGSVYTD